MAGFMKNVMSYVGMADVPEDDDYAESDVQETSFDNDRSVTPLCRNVVMICVVVLLVRMLVV